MPNRGNGRGRGRGGGQVKISSQIKDSVLTRLGVKIPAHQNERQTARKYKYVKNTTVNPSIATVATVPAEPRIRHLVRRFLKSYYDIFDQPGRVNLASQYSSDAFFSFSATFPMPTRGRNLLEVRDPETRIIVTGVFKDTSEETNPLKAFTRVFVLKQVNVDKEGEPVYEIFNDLFMLQPPTPNQIKRYHQELQNHKRLSGVPLDRPNPSGSGDNIARKQAELLQSIMTKTRMNEAGSRQLLQDCNWDEKNSIDTFNALFAQNKIPQHFFTP